MRRAAQGRGVAQALEEAAPRRAGLLGVIVGPRRQVGIAHLDRRMDQVAGHHRVLAAAPKPDREMVGRVARRRHQGQVVVEPEIAADELGALGLDDRDHAVGDAVARRLGVLGGPIVIFDLGEQIARLGEGRHPASIVQARVPTDMVEMQMGAHHHVDVVDTQPDRGQAADEIIVGLLVPERPAPAGPCRCRCSCRSAPYGAVCAPRRTGSRAPACRSPDRVRNRRASCGSPRSARARCWERTSRVDIGLFHLDDAIDL